jgi:ESCRT-II complex subunit VPS22
MDLKELRNRLVAARGRKAQHQEITEEDILIASKKLKVFGNSFNVHQISKNRYLVQSIPGELSLQETAVLGIAANQEQGVVTVQLLMKDLG